MVLPGTRRDPLPPLAHPPICHPPALVKPNFQVYQGSICWQRTGPRWRRADPSVSNATLSSFPGCKTAVSGRAMYETWGFPEGTGEVSEE